MMETHTHTGMPTPPTLPPLLVHSLFHHCLTDTRVQVSALSPTEASPQPPPQRHLFRMDNKLKRNVTSCVIIPLKLSMQVKVSGYKYFKGSWLI